LHGHAAFIMGVVGGIVISFIAPPRQRRKPIAARAWLPASWRRRIGVMLAEG
jgi:hypothetical protein